MIWRRKLNFPISLKWPSITLLVFKPLQALELIQFLIRPAVGKIRAINSPFDQEVFYVKFAERWVRQNKAVITEGVLVFHDDFHNSIIRAFQAEENVKRADEAFEAAVDLERSGGVRQSGSFATWAGRHSGRKPMVGAPETRTMQMTRVFGNK